MDEIDILKDRLDLKLINKQKKTQSKEQQISHLKPVLCHSPHTYSDV